MGDRGMAGETSMAGDYEQGYRVLTQEQGHKVAAVGQGEERGARVRTGRGAGNKAQADRGGPR